MIVHVQTRNRGFVCNLLWTLAESNNKESVSFPSASSVVYLGQICWPSFPAIKEAAGTERLVRGEYKIWPGTGRDFGKRGNMWEQEGVVRNVRSSSLSILFKMVFKTTVYQTCPTGSTDIVYTHSEALSSGCLEKKGEITPRQSISERPAAASL